MDVLKKSHEHIDEAVTNHRKDFEGMVKRLGGNIQSAL